MTRREVTHEKLDRRKCKCGATFTNENALKRHLRPAKAERVIWLDSIRNARRR